MQEGTPEGFTQNLERKDRKKARNQMVCVHDQISLKLEERGGGKNYLPSDSRSLKRLLREKNKECRGKKKK